MRGRALLRAIFTLACSCTGLASFAQDEGTGKPPFITTPANVADRMLAIAGTGPRDLVVDLGSGDGRIVIAAAQKFGARGIGLELDPALVAISRDNARAAGVADRVEFRVADVLKADFSSATVVTAYLLPWLLARLGNTFLYDLKPGSRIVTHAFSLSGWQPDRSETIVVAAPDPKAGAQTIIHLWTVPAQVRGSWHATTANGRRQDGIRRPPCRARHAGDLHRPHDCGPADRRRRTRPRGRAAIGQSAVREIKGWVCAAGSPPAARSLRT